MSTSQKHNLKSKIKPFILILCLNLIFPQQAAIANFEDNPPDITAKSAILIESSTGRILYEKNANQQRYPASTTKIMTLITALEYGDLDDIVTTSENAASTEGSSLDLVEGEKLKMIDMLYGIIMVSGNDATVAVAEHIAASVDGFARLMTQKAHSIGAFNTNFVNSSGLPDERHYSTAHDLALMAAYGYKNPLFAHIVSTSHKIMPWPGKDHDREIFNENKLLKLYEGGNGIKTGYTRAAGRCLVAGAKRFDMQLIAVVLDSEDIWQDSMALLDYGFNEAKLVNILRQGDILKTVRIKNGKEKTVRLTANVDVNIPLSETEHISEFITLVEAPDRVEAPILAGQKLGVAKVVYGNHEIATVDLVADANVERKSIFSRLWSSVLNLLTVFTRNSA